MLVFSTAIISLLLFWRFIPGWVGESVGMLAGLISTPFFMEFSFVVMGFIIVVSLNAYRNKSQGGDFVEIDPKDLPDQFRSDKDES